MRYKILIAFILAITSAVGTTWCSPARDVQNDHTQTKEIVSVTEIFKAAASDDWKEQLEKIKANSADITAADKYGWTIAHRFAHRGNLEGVKWAKANGVDITAANEDGMTIAHWFAFHGNLEAVIWAKDNGVDITTVDKESGTIAHWFTRGGNLDGVKWANDNGVDVTAVTQGGWTIAHTFAFENNLQALWWCRKNGVPFLEDGVDQYDKYLKGHTPPKGN